MINMLSTAILFAVISFSGISAYAADFFGATVTDRDVPTNAWRAGITGNRPIVETVPANSPAARYGLKQGNIILSINGKGVKSTSELHQFTSGTLSVYVLAGSEKKTLAIDALAIAREIEKKKADAARIEAERKAALPPPTTVVEEQTDNSSPVILDDTSLFLKKYTIDEDEPEPTGTDQDREKVSAPRQTSRPSQTE